ncbi:recombinase family protein [Nocardiopsis halotolerans]|uniref:recombinase family protein n=1 Tax=Nocardiopsis halotolerans TaxID=124252 RepID=UPI00034AD097|nr:recombinase family protein [Nocardiopsis halotolerans]
MSGAGPDRGFQAVVIGEPQRAFYGSQFTMTSPVFEHYGVQLRVPEIGGPIDPANEAHELIMSVYGGIPSPSAHDRKRNRHRSGIAWSKGAVRAILRNPRYTGHQVLAKQREDEVLIDVNDVQLGHQTLLRWNEDDEWIWSRDRVHDPLVTHADFTQAKALMGPRGRSPGGERKTRRTRNPYLFRGCFRVLPVRPQDAGAVVPRSGVLPLPVPGGVRAGQQGPSPAQRLPARG